MKSGNFKTEMNRLLVGARANGGIGQREFPPANLYVNDQDLFLTLEVPGIDPARVDITVTGDTIELKGERPAEPVKAGESFHRRERPSGQFKRAIQLPFEVEPSKTEATYEKGILKVRMARPESQKPKKVTVKSA